MSCENDGPRGFFDVRAEMLNAVAARRVTASIVAGDAGVVSGVAPARREIARLELRLAMLASEGELVQRGAEVARFVGSAKAIMAAEETVIGLLAKASGIATSALRFVDATGARPLITCSAWKKMPPSLKDLVRAAVKAGGASPHLTTSESFAYLDQTYVRLAGGIRQGLAAVDHLHGLLKIIQLTGRSGDIASEACEAAEAGAGIIFIDSGNMQDIPRVSGTLRCRGLREKARLAFGGGIALEDIYLLRDLDVDVLDIGRPIADAPLLDMKLELIDVEQGS